jgi:hypothetical protein
LRIELYRQGEERDRADNHDGDGEDRGEDGSIDREVGESHRNEPYGLAADWASSGESALAPATRVASGIAERWGITAIPGRTRWIPLDPAGDHPVARLETCADHPQAVNCRAEFNGAMLDDVVSVNH